MVAIVDLSSASPAGLNPVRLCVCTCDAMLQGRVTAVMSGPSCQGSLVTCAVRFNCQWLTRIVRVGERRGWDALINVILIDEGMAANGWFLKDVVEKGSVAKEALEKIFDLAHIFPRQSPLVSREPGFT
ncbi:hypothetical protein RRG08_052559 [Elysia crispata]|uniref:Uncharacterized protein n=1 Tax=Elysia crispata TaxID=231223 RepID=A0AAE0Z5V6_9GAST|nr:hypothetical protein RRG08_052559 [Elysia crispata]